MYAAVFRGVRQLPIEHVADPVAGADDIVLDVKACGVCGSDLHTYTSGLFAEPGQIMGHEFAGQVACVGREVQGVTVGDRVTGVPIQPCGECRRCRESLGHLCEVWSTRSVAFGLPGAYAERVRIPHAILGRNVHFLPATVSFEAGALVEPLSVAVHAVRQAGPVHGANTLVLGLGPIGLQITQVLLAAGATVMGVDRSPLRRSVAENFGARVLPDAADARTEPEIDLVFEVTGVPSLVDRAVEVVRARGRVVIVALYEDVARFDPTLVVHKEVEMRGSAMVTPEDFRDALDLLATGKAQADPLISQRRPLAELEEAFAVQSDPERAVKVLMVNR
jgi:2-desacetyl-2-hydroxyethyl bacteriochlorophyllide A dehydrogenase